MSFWNLSDNTKPEGNTFDMGGGGIIPANTSVLAACDEAKLDNYEGEDFINLRWTVLAPAEYANRKVFQKIRVFDTSPQKADKAKRMLTAIDANAGGKLMASGAEPTDAMLTKCLVNKPMVLKLQVWGINEKSGNWVAAVAPRAAGQVAPPRAAAPKKLVADDDDIPF